MFNKKSISFLADHLKISEEDVLKYINETAERTSLPVERVFEIIEMSAIFDVQDKILHDRDIKIDLSAVPIPKFAQVIHLLILRYLLLDVYGQFDKHDVFFAKMGKFQGNSIFKIFHNKTYVLFRVSIDGHIFTPSGERPVGNIYDVPLNVRWWNGGLRQASEAKQVFVSKPIQFFSKSKDKSVRYLSNFWPSDIIINEKTYPTVEHYFQSQKFVGTDFADIFTRESEEFIGGDPSKAKSAGSKRGTYAKQLRPKSVSLDTKEWEEREDDVMMKALKAKFTQHPDLAKKLKATGDAKLSHFERGRKSYWGESKIGKGENRLGKMLMEIRENM